VILPYRGQQANRRLQSLCEVLQRHRAELAELICRP